MNDDTLAHECLQVVTAIQTEIASRARSCDLTQILALLRQALELATVGQAAAGTIAETRSAMHPASGSPAVSDSQSGTPLAEETMDTSPPPALSMAESDDLDAASSPTGACSPVGLPAADTDTSDAGEFGSPLLHLPLRRPPPPPPSSTSTPARRSRSTGGSQRSYTVSQHFFHGQNEPGGICSLEHVPKKKPDDLVRFGAAGDTAELVQLIADVLQTQQCLTASKSSLLQTIHTVADVTTTCCPVDDDTRPSGSGAAALRAWDCAAATKHIQSLLLLCKSVEVLANYQIGQYLKYLSNGGDHEALNEVIAHLCSQARDAEVQEYRSLLANCGCSECRQDNAWLDTDRQAERFRPCKGTEVRTKCLHDTYKNFEPTYLHECATMAEAIPTNHPMLFAQNVSSPSRARLLLPSLHKNVARLERKQDRLPSSPAFLGQCTMFEVPASETVRAIDYVDGDGGFLVAELVPGLLDYLDGQGLNNLERFDDGNCLLVSFREFGHDAIELAHKYKRTDCNRTKHLGVKSMRLARRLVAQCDRLFVCTRGRVDAFGRRLIVEVVTGKDGTFTSNAQEQLSAGLSVVLRDAPAAYLECASKAEADQAGIFDIFPVSVAKSPAMNPSSLRQYFRDGATEFVVREGEAVCKVTPTSEWRNDSHITIYDSGLTGAGCGMFGRRQPPHRVWEEGQAAAASAVIRSGDQICLYAKRPLDFPAEQLATVDYAVTVEVGRRKRTYDASIYDGSNIGRFANDAGLMPGLRAMVRNSNKLLYSECDWSEVQRIAKAHCNAVFQTKGPSAIVLVATRDIVLRQRSQEIFASYSIQEYWLPCIASKVSEWGVDNEMVQVVLWAATSEQSNWPPTLRRQCLDDMRLVYPDIVNHCNVPCPWPELLESTLPPRRCRLQRST